VADSQAVKGLRASLTGQVNSHLTITDYIVQKLILLLLPPSAIPAGGVSANLATFANVIVAGDIARVKDLVHSNSQLTIRADYSGNIDPSI